MKAGQLEALKEAATWCPDHHRRDCSPLLNGCSRVNHLADAWRAFVVEHDQLQVELSEMRAAYGRLVERLKYATPKSLMEVTEADLKKGEA